MRFQTRGAFLAILLLQPAVTTAWIPASTRLTKVGARRADTTTHHRPSTLFATKKKRHQHAALNWLDEFIPACQAALASGVIAGCVLLSPTFPVDAIALQAPPPPTAQAAILEESTLPKPDAIGTVTEDVRSIEPILIPQKEDEEQYGVLDEVWSLIDKYYIDRSFGGQDWSKTKEKYKFLTSKARGDDAKFKLVSEMVSSLNDKYSRVLDQKSYTAIQKYDLIGVGVTLMPDADKNIIVGAPPIENSEAEKAGLKVGDFVSAINGIPTAGRTAFDIIDQISEIPNANTVSMTIRPKGSGPSEGSGKEITMARTFQEVKNPVRYKIAETRPDGTKVGLVKIQEFNSLLKGNLEEALAELEAAGANAYVFDIRQNTGGAFQSAVEISGLFTENHVATYVVDNTGVKLPFRTPKGKLAIDSTDPIVIWIDGRSASASEVLAGSLHDNCRAVLMGEKTFGKGLIQAVYGLKNGAGLVLTVARYVTPSGTDIQGVGITPDLEGSQYLPFGLLPGSGTDTSKIDFADIKSRLSESSCRIPDELQ